MENLNFLNIFRTFSLFFALFLPLLCKFLFIWLSIFFCQINFHLTDLISMINEFTNKSVNQWFSLGGFLFSTKQSKQMHTIKLLSIRRKIWTCKWNINSETRKLKWQFSKLHHNTTHPVPVDALSSFSLSEYKKTD